MKNPLVARVAPARRVPRAAATALAVLGLASALAACSGTATSTTDTGAAGTSGAGGAGGVQEFSPAGDIPDNQVFIPFTDASRRVTIKVPEGWARTDLPHGASFTDKLNTIELQVLDVPTPPTTDSVSQQDLPALRSQLRHFSGGEVATVDRAGTTAILATYQADGPTDPVTGSSVMDAYERYVYSRGGVEAVLTLSGPTGADNVDPWRLVSDSLRWR